MLDNFKEFLSVVQDGLQSGTNLRKTLSEVKKAKLGFINKPHQRKKCPVKLEAGALILSHHQKQWAELHAGAERASEEADKLDGLVTHIHQQATNRLMAASDLYQSLQALPKLASSVDECIEQLTNVEELMMKVEEELMQFEDLVDRQRMHQKKMEQHHLLDKYKHTKLEGLEQQRATLAAESKTRQIEREKQHILLLQSRAEESSREFNKDLKLYKDKGIVPAAKFETKGPQSLTLEQVELDNSGDDLEAFLDS